MLAQLAGEWDYRAGSERFDVNWPDVEEPFCVWVNAHAEILKTDDSHLTDQALRLPDLVIVLGSSAFTMNSRFNLLSKLEKRGLRYKQVTVATARRRLAYSERQYLKATGQTEFASELSLAMSEAKSLPRSGANPGLSQALTSSRQGVPGLIFLEVECQGPLRSAQGRS